MRLKKSKDAVLADIVNASWVNIDVSQTGYGVKGAVEAAINDAVRRAFNSLLDNCYSDEEFEKDLTLR